MNIKSFVLISCIALAGSSCKESFLDINTNPNTLPTASPNYVFTNALNTTARNIAGNNDGAGASEIAFYWAGHWTQSNSYILDPVRFAYSFTNGDFNYWDGYYDNLEDYQFVINNADGANQKFLKGPAKVMKAMLFQQLVDLYGNVPYTDALKGSATLAPKFDDQKAVYEALIPLLDEAIADLKANPSTSLFTSADITTFKGNVTKWIQFANSLKMRILIRQSKVSGRDAYIKTEINKIVTEGSGFITGEDVGVGGPGFYLATAGKTNPVYDRWGYDANGNKRALNNFPRLTQFLVNSLKTSGDTLRLKRLGYANGGESATVAGVSVNREVAANYAGVPFGIGSGFLPATASALGPYLITKGKFDNPYIIMTASEVQFLLAEAKQRYSDVTLPNTAKAYFEEGIVQSFRTLGANTAGATAYKGSKINNYDWDASTDKLVAIAVQKWISFADINGLEAWAEYRRTNQPAIPQSAQVTEPTKRPVRLYYPNTESGSNAANVKAQGDIDPFATKLFWDVD